MSRRDDKEAEYLGKTSSIMDVAKEVLAQIINFLPDATFAIDAEGKVIAWNQAMEELSGVKAKDIIGKGNYEYSMPLYGKKRPCLIDLVLNWDDKYARSYEYIEKRGDTLISETRNPPFKKPGSLFCNTARPLYDEQGNIVGAVEVIRDISERVKAEDRIRKSEATYRSLFEHAGAATIIIEEDTTISKANPEFERLSGYSKEQIEGKMSWTQFVHPEDLEQVKLYHFKRREDPKSVPSQYELRFIDRDGQTKYVLNRVTLIPGTKRSVASLLDVTFRREAEKALRASEERYRSLFENTGAATFVVDEDLTISKVNARCEAFSGYSRQELEGKKITDFISPEDLEKVKTYHAARRIDEKSVPSEYEFAWIDRNGNKKYGLIQIGLIPGTTKTIASFVDISDRRLMEEALRKSEEKYRLHFENVNDVIFSYGPDLKVIDISPSVKRVLGYKPEEFIGKSIGELNILAPDYVEKAFQDAMRVFNGERIDSSEYAFINKEGQIVYGEVSGHPIIKEGKIVGVVSVARDITKRKKAEEEKALLEEQLIQAQKMEAVGTLAGGIAHDFNNLLQAILGYSQILLINKDPDDPETVNLKQIEMSAKRARELTQQLLAFSRRVKSELRPVDLNQEVRQVEKLLKRVIPKMIEIEVHFGENLFPINADPAQLEQVMMNLCVNAKDAMPEGGRLILETGNVVLDEVYCKSHLGAKPGRYVQLTISDTGGGMDKHTLEHIFEPFFTTKEKDKGTGLGLAMVYGIVKNHGGYIMCYSELGKGTTFKIYFPVLEGRSEVQPINQKEEKTVLEGKGETVLLVDDEETIRELGKKILERFGYNVILAEDGESAIKIYGDKCREISLVIMDYVMPGMGGGKCVEEILKINPDAKIIIASGYSMNGPTKEALKLGAKGFINKPYDLREMLKIIKRFLS